MTRPNDVYGKNRTITDNAGENYFKPILCFIVSKFLLNKNGKTNEKMFENFKVLHSYLICT